MPECGSTSKFRRLGLFALLATSVVAAPSAYAVDPPPPASTEITNSGEGSGGRTQQPEEDDFRPTPYTRFGEFSDDEEDEDTKFFQYGRFFGVSLGLGYEGAMGNRGALFTGGLPAFSLRVHYWFDFNFALTLGIYSAKHQYTGARDEANSGEDVTTKHDWNLFAYGAELRYYVDTRDATAPVTFAGPFLQVGVGNYSKSENDVSDPSTLAKDNALGLSFGGGLEFPLKPRKSYLNLEVKFISVSFNDTGVPVTVGSSGKEVDTSGLLFTLMASVLFTY
jgi:hypothetical protein